MPLVMTLSLRPEETNFLPKSDVSCVVADCHVCNVLTFGSCRVLWYFVDVVGNATNARRVFDEHAITKG